MHEKTLRDALRAFEAAVGSLPPELAYALASHFERRAKAVKKQHKVAVLTLLEGEAGGTLTTPLMEAKRIEKVKRDYDEQIVSEAILGAGIDPSEVFDLAPVSTLNPSKVDVLVRNGLLPKSVTDPKITAYPTTKLRGVFDKR